MNDPDPDLELVAELRSLRLAPPSPRLKAAIAEELAGPRAVAVRPALHLLATPPRDLARTASPVRVWPSVGWAGVGALAAALTLLLLPARWRGADSTTAPGAPTAQTFFEPATAASELVSAVGGEVTYDSAEGPTQLVRYSSVERQTWTNPATGARLEVETPREDILLLPVAYQ